MKQTKKGSMKKFVLHQKDSIDEVLDSVQRCEGLHIQQVSFSTYHKALTKVCFNCQTVVTNLKETIIKPGWVGEFAPNLGHDPNNPFPLTKEI